MNAFQFDKDKCQLLILKHIRSVYVSNLVTLSWHQLKKLHQFRHSHCPAQQENLLICFYISQVFIFFLFLSRTTLKTQSLFSPQCYCLARLLKKPNLLSGQSDQTPSNKIFYLDCRFIICLSAYESTSIIYPSEDSPSSNKW